MKILFAFVTLYLCASFKFSLSCRCFVKSAYYHGRGGAARDGAMQGGRGGFGGMGFRRGPSAPAGPPVPVPPEVAIPRPTSEEVEKMNTEIKRFIDTNTSANKDLLKKYASLINVQVPRANSAIAPVQTMVRTTECHDGFVEIAKKGDFEILFEGDDGRSGESSDEALRLRRADLNTTSNNPWRSEARAWAPFVPLSLNFHDLV